MAGAWASAGGFRVGDAVWRLGGVGGCGALGFYGGRSLTADVAYAPASCAGTLSRFFRFLVSPRGHFPHVDGYGLRFEFC